MNKKDDWWCPTCKFTIWGSKSQCLKCGHPKPRKPVVVEKINYWTPGNTDPKYNNYGPYSIRKGGYSGPGEPDEPKDLKFPQCGCKELQYCPQRHHETGCRCYTCRGKPHKW